MQWFFIMTVINLTNGIELQSERPTLNYDDCNRQRQQVIDRLARRHEKVEIHVRCEERSK